MTAQYFKDDPKYDFTGMIRQSLYQNPLAKESTTKQRRVYEQDEIMKTQRELVEGLDDVFIGMHESKTTWDNLYNELDDLYDKIQLRKESLQR